MFHLIARHRGVTSNMRGSVSFDIQILCSDISHMRRSVLSDIQKKKTRSGSRVYKKHCLTDETLSRMLDIVSQIINNRNVEG